MFVHFSSFANCFFSELFSLDECCFSVFFYQRIPRSHTVTASIMRVSPIYMFGTVVSILNQRGLVYAATEAESSTFLNNNDETPKLVAPCSLRLRHVLPNTFPNPSVLAITLEHLKAIARRLASIAPIKLIDAASSDMGCHAKALRGGDSSAPVLLFDSTTMNENTEHNVEDGSNHKSSAQLMNESQMKRIVKGARVAVYWPSHNQYYEAKVLQVATGTFYVQYVDDQVAAWVDASRDTFRFVRGPRGSSKSQKGEVHWTQVKMGNFLRSADSIDRIQNDGNDNVI